jgi:uncharacterized membrane protein
MQSRNLAVDFARVLAIVLMIQGHTLDVLLSPTHRESLIFNLWLFVRGLTAPTFFTLSGISFMLASVRHWDSYLHASPQVFRRLGRFTLFIGLGYLMHLPIRTYYDIKWLDTAGWQSGLQVDVLQCIGFTLVSLQILLLLSKTPARFAKLSVSIGAAIVILTPLIWKVDWSQYLPLSLASYLTGHTGSWFPLFPWSGYPLIGVGLGYLYAQQVANGSRLPLRPLVWGGTALLALGLSLQKIPITIFANIDYWRSSPNLFLVRIGCIGLVFAMLYWLVQQIWLPRQPIHSLAKESLTIYFVHICILYGSLWNTGLKQTIGANLSWLPTLGWIAVMLTTMLLLGWTWNRFKSAQPLRTHLVRAAIAVAVAYSLL